MPTTFIVTVILCVLVVLYWRMALVIALAIVLALLASGVNTVAQALGGPHGQPTSSAPAQPGGQPRAPGAPSDSSPVDAPAPHN